MDLIIMIIVIISAVLLVLVIMLQDEQGEGLGGIFGGGSGSAFGSRSGNILTRITAVLATVFLLLTLGLAFIKKSSTKDTVSEIAREEQYKEASESAWITKAIEDETDADQPSIISTLGSDEESPTDETDQ